MLMPSSDDAPEDEASGHLLSYESMPWVAPARETSAKDLRARRIELDIRQQLELAEARPRRVH